MLALQIRATRPHPQESPVLTLLASLVRLGLPTKLKFKRAAITIYTFLLYERSFARTYISLIKGCRRVAMQQ